MLKYYCFILSIAFVCCGCASNKSDSEPEVNFISLTDEEAKKHDVWVPVSSSMIEALGLECCGNLGIVDGIVHRADSPEKLKRSFKKMRNILSLERKCIFGYSLEELKKHAGKNLVYYFQERNNIIYSSGDKVKKSKDGFVVIHGDQEVFRKFINSGSEILGKECPVDDEFLFKQQNFIMTPAPIIFLEFVSQFYCDDAWLIIDYAEKNINFPEKLISKMNEFLKIREPWTRQEISKKGYPCYPLFFRCRKDWDDFKKLTKNTQVYFYMDKPNKNGWRNPGFCIDDSGAIVYHYAIKPSVIK